MPNIINAICNLTQNALPQLKKYITNYDFDTDFYDDIKTYEKACMRTCLEEYIKDLFAGVPNDATDEVRNALIQGAFSYAGNQNNPPNAMLRGGDAIEVKKIESKSAALALNSSYPKHKLYADSSLISNACREAENWTEKDIIYAVGVVKDNNLESLAFVYGEDYCANKETYETITNIKLDESTVSNTIKKSDFIGTTFCHVIQKWSAKSPFEYYKDFYAYDDKVFNFMCIINEKKWNSFDNTAELEELAKLNERLKISDVKIKNPDNPAQLRNAKLITYTKKVALC